MKTLHSFSESQNPYFFKRDRRRFAPTTGIYQNNEYIKQLNHLLAMEIGTVELYSQLHYQQWESRFQKCLENHKEIGHIVYGLIVSNQGIPEPNATTLPTELSIMATKLGKQFGNSIGAKTSCKICLAMEHFLRRRYYELIEIAPLGDRGQLNLLLFITKANLICLEESRH